MKKNDSPLRAARLKLGLTLEALASAASCNTGTLSRIERGKQCPPDLAQRLCDVIGRERLTEMQVLYPEREIGVARHDVAIQPQTISQIKNSDAAFATNARSAVVRTDVVRQTHATVRQTPTTLGPNPPQRIKIEGHTYRLERKAGA